MNISKVKEYILHELATKLDTRLTYHSIYHTLDVLQAAENLARLEKLNENEIILLQTAAVFHDTGMLKTYVGHEDASIILAREILPGYGYTPRDLDIIEGLIMATRLPQTAHTHLQNIICDADLDYLGRNDFFMIAHQLKYEWEMMEFKKTTLREWYELQIIFLGNHKYFTDSARQLREEKKQENLKQVEELVCFMKE